MIGGLGVSAWGWKILAKSKKIKQWPTTEGVIEESIVDSQNLSSTALSSKNSDLLPHIVFSYNIQGKQYQCVFEFPEGTHPLPEFNQAYIKKYPVGRNVEVFYNPEQSDIATLETETPGDWMIIAMGIMMTIGSVIALVIN